MPRGGWRPGSGRPKGTKEPHTLDKIEAREYVRKRVQERLAPLLDALFAKATGTKFLVYRDEDGRFIPMTERAIKAVKAKNYERLEVYDRQPDVSAIQELLNRCLDKPKEQRFEIDVHHATLEDLILGKRKE